MNLRKLSTAAVLIGAGLLLVAYLLDLQNDPLAETLRDAVEPVAHVTSWRGEGREAETNHYRLSFDVEWWVNREHEPRASGI